MSRANSVASRSSAWPLQYASRQPRPGQLPGHGGPSGSIVKWPSSAPIPCAPRKIWPSITTPPPTPVPSVSIRSTDTGASSTSWASASAAQLASLSTYTGTPKRRDSSSRSGTPVSGTFTLDSTVPLAYSIWEGTPTPTATGGPVASITRRAVASRPSSRASVLSSTVGDCSRCSARPPTIAATAILVPPTSTPSTRGSLLTGGLCSLGRAISKRERKIAVGWRVAGPAR